MSILISLPNTSAAGNGLSAPVDLVAGFTKSGLDVLYLMEDGASGPYSSIMLDSSGNGRNATLTTGVVPSKGTDGLTTSTAAAYAYSGPSNYNPHNFTMFVAAKLASTSSFPNFGQINPWFAAANAGDTVLNTGVWLNNSSLFRQVRETNSSILPATWFAMAISVNTATPLLTIRTSWGTYSNGESAAFAYFAGVYATGIIKVGNAFNGSGSQAGNKLGLLGVYNSAKSISDMDDVLDNVRARMKLRGIKVL